MKPFTTISEHINLQIVLIDPLANGLTDAISRLH